MVFYIATKNPAFEDDMGSKDLYILGTLRMLREGIFERAGQTDPVQLLLVGRSIYTCLRRLRNGARGSTGPRSCNDSRMTTFPFKWVIAKASNYEETVVLVKCRSKHRRTSPTEEVDNGTRPRNE